MRLIKLLVVLIVAAVIALVGYAYLGDMEPNQREVRDPIPIQDGALAPAETGPESGTESAQAEEAPTEAAPAEEQPAPIISDDTTEAPGD